MRIENSFIPVEGVGELTERRLWEAGITHWGAFYPDAVGPTTAERIESFIEEAERRLDAGDAHFFGRRFPSRSRWRLYENFREETCFLDIETTGLSPARDAVTVVSIHRGGETATLVRGDDLTVDRLRDELSTASLLVTFNGAQFDVPFLESAYDLRIDVPHVDLRYPCRRLGLAGGLKRIESRVGIDRDEPDIDGREAIRLWRAYERGDDGALETLIRYNRDDTVNLQTLMDHVADTLHREVFERACSLEQRRLG